jgi:hypothetical protein
MDAKDFKIDSSEHSGMPDWMLAELEVGTPKICQHCGWRRNDHFGEDLVCPCADSRHDLPVSAGGPACLSDCEQSPVQGHFLTAAL